MNDSDRAEWIDNDEGLYDWWRFSRQSKRNFIRANREELTRYIELVTSGQQPAHFGLYG
jgi:hypothetical protein